MSDSEDRYIRIPDDIKFLLEFCRELLRKFKNDYPNNEIPVSFEQIKKLRSIEQIYTGLEFRIGVNSEINKLK